MSTANDPTSLIIFPNPEKANRFQLGPDEYMPMSSSRILLSAMPGCGKRNVILNIVSRMSPPPSVVHLVHCDPNTTEYDILAEDMKIPVLTYDPADFPTLENIEAPDPVGSDSGSDAEAESDDRNPLSDPVEGGRNPLAPDPEGPTRDTAPPLANPLVIVDECTSEQLGKAGSARLERLVNHVCTHRNTTLMCSIQSLLNIPAKARRGFNHLALWPQADTTVNQMAAQRAGLKYDMLKDLFGLCKSRHDFIWIDLDRNPDSPWRYRLNFSVPITIVPARESKA